MAEKFDDVVAVGVWVDLRPFHHHRSTTGRYHALIHIAMLAFANQLHTGTARANGTQALHHH